MTFTTQYIICNISIVKYMHSLIIANRDFPKDISKKKPVILDSYIKEDISAG